MDILISFVGNRDPYAPNDSEGPVLAAIRQIKPDLCFLFGTDPGINEKVANTYQKAMEIKSIVENERKNIKVVPLALSVPDPTNYNEILLQLEKHLKDIRKKYKTTNPKYHVNISPGTAQMQTSLLIILNAERIGANIYQVKDPQYVENNADRIKEIDIKFIEEENYIKRAKKLFERYCFKEAADELIELGCFTIREKREKRAEMFALICEGYDFWDKYEHEKALEKLEKAHKDLDRYNFQDLANIISQQIAILKEIIKEKPKETILTLKDLLHNAARRKDEGKPMDCLMRYKRLIDGMTAYKCGLIGYKDLKGQPKWVKDILLDRKETDHLYYNDYLRLYKEKNNKEMFSKELQDKIKSLNKKRNDCSAAHGMGSASERDALEAMNLLWKIASKLFTNENLQEYIFSADRVKEISQSMFDNL